MTITNAGSSARDLSLLTFGAIFLLILAGQSIILHFMGMNATCPCGVVKVWSNLVDGPENSQQLTDWYSYTHVLHGFAFWFGSRLIAPRMPFLTRLALCVALEAGWEIFENTPFIIDRYRQTTVNQGYTGDSILNSAGDVLAMTGGFLLAAQVPVWATLAIFVAVELVLGYMIGDNLTLNIVHLIWPAG
jgi:hypothetical protein